MTADSEYLEAVKEALTKLFALAREHFFPEWDSEREWQIVAGRRKRSEGETGYCSSKEKRIYIDPQGVKGMPYDGGLALIIHEICHDVATAHHTERWVKRMEAAAQTAETLSQPELANKIRASAYAEIPLDKPWREKWCKYLYHKIDWNA
jgi:hypothetical protein